MLSMIETLVLSGSVVEYNTQVSDTQFIYFVINDSLNMKIPEHVLIVKNDNLHA